MQLVNSVDDFADCAQLKESAIPVIKNENIDEQMLINYEVSHSRNDDRIDVESVVFVSRELLFLTSVISKIYRYENIIFLSDIGEQKLGGKVIVVGLYDDLSMINISEIENIFSNEAEWTFLLGEDIASLSFQIAKQGFHIEKKESLIVVGNYLSSSEMELAEQLEEKGIKVLTYKNFNESNIAEILKQTYKTVLIFSHGKDDHINIGEYTICGRHKVDQVSCRGPVCLTNNSCFKCDEKLIKISEFKAENIILASCHSGVFLNANNYDREFNLMLGALYSDARTITFSTSGSRFDFKELVALLSARNVVSPAKIINSSLSDIHIAPVYFTIGNLDGELFEEKFGKSIKGYADESIENIFKALKVFIEYNFLPENEEFVTKVYSLYRWGIRNISRANRYLPVYIRRVAELKSQLDELDKELAQYFGHNYYAIGDMSSFALNNLSVDKHRGDDVCCCGNKSFSYNFSYNGMKMDNIQETFCYKCCNSALHDL